MADVDPASGLPKETVEKPKNVEQFARLNDQKARADQLRADLDTPQGQALMNAIQSQLLKRVNELIEDDPQCRTLRNLLIEMGMTVAIGERAVQGLMRLR